MEKPKKVSRYRQMGEGSGLVFTIVTVVALLALWWVATHAGWIKPLFLPKPETILIAFQQAWEGEFDNNTLLGHFGWSMMRVFGAFALAVLIGIPVGIAMGVSRIARGIFDAPIEFYRPLPPLAYLPLMIIWFGIGELSKTIVIIAALFPFDLDQRDAGSALGQPAQDPGGRIAGRVALDDLPPRGFARQL
ncbi:MAG: hypothetical protein HC850_11455, partial [Rhodomicrobium sp.]|nr:hypothetical protein [Rhodomicrobium sp.]